MNSPNSASFIEYPLEGASTLFDYLVRLSPDSVKRNDLALEGPGSLVVYRKGLSTPVQTLDFDNLYVTIGPNGLPEVNSAPLYAEQAFINVGDFNFDGYEDFAVQKGHDGPYGGPTYDVYLFDPQRSHFTFSEPLTDLIKSTLGFFQVDSARKVLRTFAKSGGAYHETVEYEVRANQPIPIARVVEDARRDPEYVYISRQQMVNGTWQGEPTRISRAEFESGVR